MKREFLQFYTMNRSRRNNKIHSRLYNGFSYVWDEASPRWVFYEYGNEVLPELEFLSDEIYVSVFFEEHLKFVIHWARKFPEIKFIIGGPAIWPCSWWLNSSTWPSNIEVKEGVAESLFNKEINLKDWKLLPPKAGPRSYSYHIDENCYWRKCSFCTSRIYHGQDHRGYDLEPLWSAPPGLVHLITRALSPSMIPLLRELNYINKSYQFYMRGTKEELDILNKVLRRVPCNRLYIFIGVEFPSNRMLKYMNKGTTTKELTDTINFCLGSGCNLTLSFITSWPNLIYDDLEEAKKFFKTIYDNEDGHILYAYGKLIKEPVKKNNNFPLEARYIPYHPIISDEARKLDKEWLSLLNSRKLTNNYTDDAFPEKEDEDHQDE